MTRLYQHHGAGGFGQGATHDFALPFDDDGPGPLPTAAKGRTCPVCGTLLSVYNLDELCGACERRAGEPLRPEDLQRVFEAVVGALTEPWELPKRPGHHGRLYVTVREAAAELFITEDAVRWRLRHGALSGKRYGCGWRVLRSALQQVSRD